MSEDSVAIRLKFFLDQSGMSNSQFADKCGIPRPSLSQLLTGRNKKISDVLVRQIHDAFPQLSITWLLFGEGDMLVSAPASSSELSSPLENSIFTEDGMDFADDSNLAAQNPPFGSANYNDSQQFMYAKPYEKIDGKKDKTAAPPRKVTQITVYYDDSTFETFYPGK